MKLISALWVFVIAATSASATPYPVAEADARGCRMGGESCWKEKRVAAPDETAERAAEAVAEALAQPATGKFHARCDIFGEACYNARKLARDFTEVTAATTEDPEAYISSLNLENEDEFSKRAEDRLKREADVCELGGELFWKEKHHAEAVAEAKVCRLGGESWLKAKAKREAEADAIAYRMGGETCWKEKREAEASAEADARGCRMGGESCWKVKRAAEALVEAEAEADARGCRMVGNIARFALAQTTTPPHAGSNLVPYKPQR